MTISVECPQTAFQAPAGYSDANLGSVAAVFCMRRAVSGQEARLAAAFGEPQVADALQRLGQLSEYFVAGTASLTSADVTELKAYAASHPFKHDYADVAAQRQMALEASIVEAEATLHAIAPTIDMCTASIATTALFWEQVQGSPDAADVLVSRHVPDLWEMATGEREVPSVFALDLVAQAPL